MRVMVVLLILLVMLPVAAGVAWRLGFDAGHDQARRKVEAELPSIWNSFSCRASRWALPTHMRGQVPCG
jgi:hypothetical protein